MQHAREETRETLPSAAAWRQHCADIFAYVPLASLSSALNRLNLLPKPILPSLLLTKTVPPYCSAPSCASDQPKDPDCASYPIHLLTFPNAQIFKVAAKAVFETN